MASVIGPVNERTVVRVCHWQTVAGHLKGNSPEASAGPVFLWRNRSRGVLRNTGKQFKMLTRLLGDFRIRVFSLDLRIGAGGVSGLLVLRVVVGQSEHSNRFRYEYRRMRHQVLVNLLGVGFLA